jgi:hypothetical protein
MNTLGARVADAIRQIQSSIRWKPGEDTQHLKRRIVMNRLLQNYATAVNRPNVSGFEHLPDCVSNA